jgi:hypothetical protein
MGGLGDSNFKARYQDDKHSGESGWHCCRFLPWRKSFDEAQSDLNKYAKEKRWAVINL